MREQRQITVEANPTTKTGKGARTDINLRSAFPSSPIYSGDITAQERKEVFQELVLDGEVLNGHGLNSFNRDYKDAPNLEEVETGGGGLPASPFVPNLMSPGPGSVSAADQNEFTGDLPNPELRNNFGSGQGGLVSPSQTAGEMAKQGTLSSYISGRSYKGSDGKA